VVYSKPSMKLAEAGNKLVKSFTVSILVNRMARQYTCLIKHAETLLRTKDCCTHFIVTCATGCTHPI
jgi:hypothetical protein